MPFASLEHRRFLAASAPRRAAGDGALFARLGGQPAVDALVDALYDRFEADEVLRPLFGRDLVPERARQKRFFAEWLGGPARYGEAAYAGLAHRHEHLGITRALAGRWLGHLRHALAATVAAEADRALVLAQAQAVAFALAEQAGPTLPASPRPGDLHCGRLHPIHEATRLARRGELAPLRAWLAEHPEALRPATLAAMALHAAALAGHAAIVEHLVGAGVAVDRPYFLPVGSVGVAFERVIFVTPLCAARTKRRDAVLAVLARAGAREDVFTAAFLGDVEALARALGAEPALAQASDPATDVVDLTPVHHAIAGGHVGALRALLAHGDGPVVAGTRALRGAAARSDAAMVGLLLGRGASAAGVGPGRWVLHPELAARLGAAGATAADPEARWIAASCTGNQGRKDDPGYVRALLDHGAQVDDRHAGATALHHAARAGFLGTIRVLLAAGADRGARDDRGRTPLDWVERAARRVDRAAVRRALGASGRG